MCYIRVEGITLGLVGHGRFIKLVIKSILFKAKSYPSHSTLLSPLFLLVLLAGEQKEGKVGKQ